MWGISLPSPPPPSYKLRSNLLSFAPAEIHLLLLAQCCASEQPGRPECEGAGWRACKAAHRQPLEHCIPHKAFTLTHRTSSHGAPVVLALQACNPGTQVASYGDSPYTFSPSDPGTYYFYCTPHCDYGQRIEIVVSQRPQPCTSIKATLVAGKNAPKVEYKYSSGGGGASQARSAKACCKAFSEGKYALWHYSKDSSKSTSTCTLLKRAKRVCKAVVPGICEQPLQVYSAAGPKAAVQELMTCSRCPVR